jgi:hypothetical protein
VDGRAVVAAGGGVDGAGVDGAAVGVAGAWKWRSKCTGVPGRSGMVPVSLARNPATVKDTDEPGVVQPGIAWISRMYWPLLTVAEPATPDCVAVQVVEPTVPVIVRLVTGCPVGTVTCP